MPVLCRKKVKSITSQPPDTMRYDKVLASFIAHSDWYTFVKGIGYVPTDIAPPEAVEAMQKFNSYGFSHPEQVQAFLEEHTGHSDLQEFFEKVRDDVENRKTPHNRELD